MGEEGRKGPEEGKAEEEGVPLGQEEEVSFYRIPISSSTRLGSEE